MSNTVDALKNLYKTLTGQDYSGDPNPTDAEMIDAIAKDASGGGSGGGGGGESVIKVIEIAEEPNGSSSVDVISGITWEELCSMPESASGFSYIFKVENVPGYYINGHIYTYSATDYSDPVEQTNPYYIWLSSPDIVHGMTPDWEGEATAIYVRTACFTNNDNKLQVVFNKDNYYPG